MKNILLVNGISLFNSGTHLTFTYNNRNLIKFDDFWNYAYLYDPLKLYNLKYTLYKDVKLIYNVSTSEEEAHKIYDQHWDNLHSNSVFIPSYPGNFVVFADWCQRHGYTYRFFDADLFFLQNNNYVTINNWKELLEKTCAELDNYLVDIDTVIYSWDIVCKNRKIAIDLNEGLIQYIGRKCHTIVGGRNISETKLNNNVQYVSGEDIRQLNLDQKTSLSKVHYKCKKSDIKVNKGYIFSYKDILKLYNYTEIESSKIPDKTIGCCCFCFEMTHYCNNVCAFCNYSKLVNSNKSNKSIYNNFNVLKTLYNNGFNTACIYDCNILSSKRKIETVSKFLAKNNINMNFIFGVSLKQLNERNVKTLVDMGLKIANIGIETLQPEVQKLINKRLSPEEIQEKMDMLVEYNVGIMLNFITCLPLSNTSELSVIDEFLTKNSSKITGCNITPFYLCGDILRNPNKYGIKIFRNMFYHKEKGPKDLITRKKQFCYSVEYCYNKLDYPSIDSRTPLYICLQDILGAKKANEEFRKIVIDMYGAHHV